MTRTYFGTDGMRGTANIHPITPDVVLRLAVAAGRLFRRGSHRHKAIIGKDTRLSGYMLEPALTSGFVSAGMDVFLVGPMPSPAVAMLTKSMRCDVGVMISASHNPYRDNGIKLFGPDGYKLSNEKEQAIEALMNGPLEELATPEQLGRAKRLEDAPGRYNEFAKQTFPSGLRLDGLKIVVDCANGAAYHIAPSIFYELGAEIVPVSVAPNGTNINEACGATAPTLLSRRVVEHGADIGIALDGDADRLIVCDETGHVLDGDQVMALVAAAHVRRGLLRGPVVTTVMSNLGLERHLRTMGVEMLRTPVGDRHVTQTMREQGSNLGGEQSGHIILGDYVTTGDGIVAALQVLSVLVERGDPMSQLGRVFEPVPQLLENVRFKAENGQPLDLSVVRTAIAEGEACLRQKGGRLLVRKSGTEPLIRIMAEGEDKALIQTVVAEIRRAVEQVAA